MEERIAPRAAEVDETDEWPADLYRVLVESELTGFGFVHHAQPRAISVSQLTELGTAYTPDQLAALAELAHSHGMVLHVDGARLANAAVGLGCSLAATSAEAGVDVLSLGGTKNGMLAGEAVVRTLGANDVDLALMGRPPGELDLVAAPFADHPHVIIAPPDHPLAGRRRVDVAALAAEVFLVRELGSGTRTAMERFFREHGVPLRVGMEMPSNETIKQAVMAGLGLSFISLHTIALELSARALALVRAQGLPVMRRWMVVHRKEKRLAPAPEAFKKFVLEHGGGFLERWRGGA